MDTYDSKSEVTERYSSMNSGATTIVDFDDNDPENPVNWPSWRKWSITILVSTINFISVLATNAIVPAAPQALADLRSTDSLYLTFLVSVWELGEGVGPFIIAPVSELFGRLPVLHIGNVLAVACGVGCALSTNLPMLVAFRFLNGCVITALVLGPTIIGDMFTTDQRGKAMAVAISTQILGGFVAPICGSFIAQRLGWRWVIWVAVIAMAVVSLACLVVVRETYPVKILQHKARRVRKATGRADVLSKFEDSTNAMSTARKVVKTMTNPIQIFLFSPIVAVISLYTALAYGVSYLILTTLTEIMEERYAFSQGTVGLAFLSRGIGYIIAILLYGLTSDRYIKKKQMEEGGKFKPEHRLTHLILGAAALPVGLVLYGWTAAYFVQYVAPLIGISVVGFGVVLTVLPTENYLVDVYPIQSASAIAAGVILRAVFGAVFPLCGPSLYRHLSLGWGNTILAFLALAFLPILVILWRHGERFRGRDRHAGL